MAETKPNTGGTPPAEKPKPEAKAKGPLVKLRVIKTSGLFWKKGRPKLGDVIEVPEDEARKLVAARHASDPSGKLKPPKAAKPKQRDEDEDEDDDEETDDEE